MGEDGEKKDVPLCFASSSWFLFLFFEETQRTFFSSSSERSAVKFENEIWKCTQTMEHVQRLGEEELGQPKSRTKTSKAMILLFLTRREVRGASNERLAYKKRRTTKLEMNQAFEMISFPSDKMSAFFARDRQTSRSRSNHLSNGSKQLKPSLKRFKAFFKNFKTVETNLQTVPRVQTILQTDHKLKKKN